MIQARRTAALKEYTRSTEKVERGTLDSFTSLLEPVSSHLESARAIYSRSLLASAEVLPPSQVPGIRPISTSTERVPCSELISGMAEYLNSFDGKWLRPALVLLSTGVFGEDPGKAAPIGAALELIHNATLIHDDIIDESETRRGRRALWKRWGSGATVLMGDLLYAKAFELTTRHGSIEIQEMIATATGRMCQGELQQLESCGKTDVTEEEYLNVIANKTACLMSACTQSGSMVAEAEQEDVERMRLFGINLGMAFQIVDDLLDYVADPEILGKSIGNDLARGKVTLPLIHHLASTDDPQPIIDSICGSNGNGAKDVRSRLSKTRSIDYARDKAREYGRLARQQLEEISQDKTDDQFRNTLFQLADFVISRGF